MNRKTKAIMLRQKILQIDNAFWEFSTENGAKRVLYSHENWSALIWGKPTIKMLTARQSVDRDIFLEACRKHGCPHTLDVWADDLGKVFSGYYDGGLPKVIRLVRGTWETRYFGFPSPKSLKSHYYVPT